MEERLEDKYPDELNMCRELFVFFIIIGDRRTDLLLSRPFWNMRHFKLFYKLYHTDLGQGWQGVSCTR